MLILDGFRSKYGFIDEEFATIWPSMHDCFLLKRRNPGQTIWLVNLMRSHRILSDWVRKCRILAAGIALDFFRYRISLDFYRIHNILMISNVQQNPIGNLRKWIQQLPTPYSRILQVPMGSASECLTWQNKEIEQIEITKRYAFNTHDSKQNLSMSV